MNCFLKGQIVNIFGLQATHSVELPSSAMVVRSIHRQFISVWQNFIYENRCWVGFGPQAYFADPALIQCYSECSGWLAGQNDLEMVHDMASTEIESKWLETFIAIWHCHSIRVNEQCLTFSDGRIDQFRCWPCVGLFHAVKLFTGHAQ